MPNRDGTGPDGKGPKTGRGRGRCKPRDTKSGNWIRVLEGANPSPFAFFHERKIRIYLLL